LVRSCLLEVLSVLDRRIREEVIILDNETGEKIVVAPTGFRRNQIKIGIEACKTRYTILRRGCRKGIGQQPSPDRRPSSPGFVPGFLVGARTTRRFLGLDRFLSGRFLGGS